MKPFKYLDCDRTELISNKVLDYLSNLPDYDPKFVGQKYLPKDDLSMIEQIPELKELLQRYNLDVRRIFYVHHTHSGVVHVDGSKDIRVFLPVRNTADTALTHFYELESVREIPQIKNGGAYSKLEYDSKKLIGTYHMTQPLIAHTGIPHQVVFKHPLIEPRVTVSMHLARQPTELLL
jgi:hypothetical protein